MKLPGVESTRPDAGVTRIFFVSLIVVCTISPCFLIRDAECREGSSTSGELLTLEDAVSIALTRNSRIGNAQLQVEKAGDEVSAVRTKLFPEIDFDVYHAYHLTREPYEFDQGVFGNYPVIGPVPAQNVEIDTARDFTTLFTASVKQPISQIYEILLYLKQKKVQKEIFRQDLRSKQQETADNVKETYCGILKIGDQGCRGKDRIPEGTRYIG
jgi:outer membrane protein TolC